MQIYLDNSATTKVNKEVAASVYRMMTEDYGNPSSLHTLGQDAERTVRQARHQIAFVLGARAGQIVFTGSGSEADNLAFASVFHSPARIPGRKILISALEHPAVREPAAYYESLGAEVVRIPVHESGTIDLDFLRGALDETVAMISVMHVSNEIGTIQPIREIVKIIAGLKNEPGKDVRFHVDAIQSFSKLPIDVVTGDFFGVDMISLSSHKIHGPKGVGALYAAKPEKLHPMIRGGGQEFGVRSGTENVPAIVGFGQAARIESAEQIAHAKQAADCRKYLMDRIVNHFGNECRINSPSESSLTGAPGLCSPYILSVSFPGTRGEVIVHDLERNGIFVSTGSACSSISRSNGSISPTLAAIGLSAAEAQGTLRFSFSRHNQIGEMDCVLEHLIGAVGRFNLVGTRR
ncbi:MAG: cysteine desulfurase [Clostridiales Family XIII bacterium]|jgi:cysteine desulfurase|nr:cysteine desulfurase [Clostridiales Family XIII bacterium]